MLAAVDCVGLAVMMVCEAKRLAVSGITNPITHLIFPGLLEYDIQQPCNDEAQ